MELETWLSCYCIPTRYPDAYAEGSPHENCLYRQDDVTAKEVQRAAARVIRWVKGAHPGAWMGRSDCRSSSLSCLDTLHLSASSAFLYGSVARGNFNLHSDIDLLVVALPEPPLERSQVLYRYVRGRKEPKGLTSAEFGRLSVQGKLEYLEGAQEF